jgi:hypothetical protein
MKRFLLILAVLVFVSPAMAVVTITAVDNADGTADIQYAADPNDAVSGFGIDITVDANVVIADVCDYVEGESVTGNIGYGIFPGTIDVNTVSGDINDAGTPVAPSLDPGALGGLGTNGVTLEMGALYVEGNEPPLTGTLCTIVLGNCDGATGTPTLTLAGNSTRGNVVKTDSTEATVVYNGTTVSNCYTLTDCFPTTPDYAQQRTDFLAYQAAGANPDCWCQPGTGTLNPAGYQCDGDAANDTQLIKKYRVYTNDLNLVTGNWKTVISNAPPCADMDHGSQLIKKYRVYTNDLNRVTTNWKKVASELPGDCPRPDATK